MSDLRPPREQFQYEIPVWLARLGSEPVRTLAHEDLSASYEMTAAHVFELANGQYALVTESGCSCYEPENAHIELFPDASKALAAFMKWVKENRR